MAGVSVGSCRCKHFLFPQSYDEDEVRCHISIIIIACIVIVPALMILLAICYKIKSRGRSKVDVSFHLSNQSLQNSNR